MHKHLKVLITTLAITTSLLVPNVYALDKIKTEILSNEQITKIKNYTHKLKTTDNLNINNIFKDNKYNSSTINYGNIGCKEIVSSCKQGVKRDYILTFEDTLSTSLDEKTKNILCGEYSLEELLRCGIIQCNKRDLKSLSSRVVTTVICNSSNNSVIFCDNKDKVIISFPQYIYTMYKGMIDNNDFLKLVSKIDNKSTYTIKPNQHATNIIEKIDLRNTFKYIKDKSKLDYTLPKSYYTIDSILNSKCIKLNKRWLIVNKSLIGNKSEASKYRKYVKCFLNNTLIYSDDNDNVDILVSNNLALVDSTIIDLDKIFASANISDNTIQHFTVEVIYSPLVSGQSCIEYKNNFKFTVNSKDSFNMANTNIKDESLLRLYHIAEHDINQCKSSRYIPFLLLLIFILTPILVVDIKNSSTTKINKTNTTTKK